MRELVDRPEVVEDKVLYLASLLALSRRTVVYSGAGVSTSCGVRQRAPGSCQPARSRTTNAQPSPAHLLLSAMVRAGLVQAWVTLCCDGLAQKAGCPQETVLEVHGSWYDPTNPVLRQGGKVRPDIGERLRELEDTADLVVVVGSSLTGNTGDLVTRASTRAGQGQSLGSVIINLAETREDPGATLRLFSHSDTVAVLLARRLNLALREPDIRTNIQHRAWVPYTREGERTESEDGMFLDLSPGQEVRLNYINNCQHSGQPALLHIQGGQAGQAGQGGRQRGGGRGRGRGRVVKYCPTQRAWELELEGVKMLLGYWWLGTSTLHLPLVNWRPSYK